MCEKYGVPVFSEGISEGKHRHGLHHLPHLNHHRYVVHPYIVAYSCGHCRPDVSGPPEGFELPPVEYLFEWLRFDRYMANRATLRDMANLEHARFENIMEGKEMALFKIILE